jgi:hypothetical protein
VLAVVAVVAAFYGAMVSVRLHQHGNGPLWFAHLGSHFTASSHTSKIIGPQLGAESADGYDGQFYYFIAADPTHGRDYMHYGRDDQSGVRYARIAYPLLARGLSVGDARAVPYALVSVNVAAMCVGTAALAVWFVRRRRSPWAAVIYGLWPGLVFSVFRDLSEPVAYALVALAVLCFDVTRTRRLAGAAVLFAVALLAKETTIVFPLVAGAALTLHDRAWRRAAFFVAGSLGPMLAWRLALTLWFHVSTLERAGGWTVLVPFYGMAKQWPWDAVHWLMFWTLDLPLVLAGVVGLYLLHARRAIVRAASVLLNLALFVVFIPRDVMVDFGAAGRNATPVLLAALFLIPALSRRTAVLMAAALSPLWYLAIASSLDVAGFQLVTS